jgi:ADP-ribose pyrophosphatase
LIALSFYTSKASSVLAFLLEKIFMQAEQSSKHAHLQEKQLSSQEVFQGHFLHAFLDEVKLPDGASSVREYIKHPGAVVIVAELDDGRFVMERQFRYPIAQAVIEFPAGKIDPGEDRLTCAQRELMEETGYRAREWARVGVMHPCMGYSNEFIEIWFARGLSLGERRLDEGEFLDVFTATLEELLAWSQSGELTDAKTLSCLLWLQNVRSGQWAIQWQSVAEG